MFYNYISGYLKVIYEEKQKTLEFYNNKCQDELCLMARKLGELECQQLLKGGYVFSPANIEALEYYINHPSVLFIHSMRSIDNILKSNLDFQDSMRFLETKVKSLIRYIDLRMHNKDLDITELGYSQTINDIQYTHELHYVREELIHFLVYGEFENLVSQYTNSIITEILNALLINKVRRL